MRGRIFRTGHTNEFLHSLDPYQPFKLKQSSHPLTGLCQEAIAFRRNSSVASTFIKAQRPATRLPANSNRIRFLAPLAANRIAPVTHQVQACRDVLRPPWRHGPPQRNVGTKLCPRGWSHSCGCRDGDASPLLAHGLGDSVICYSIGWRKDGVQSLSWLYSRLLAGSPSTEDRAVRLSLPRSGSSRACRSARLLALNTKCALAHRQGNTAAIISRQSR